MEYGDKKKYCEIFETCTDYRGREVENCIARWISPDEDPSLQALERSAQDLGRSLGKNLQCRIYER